MSERTGTVAIDGRVFIGIDTLREGIQILEDIVTPELYFKALREVLDGLEKATLNE